MDDQLQSIDAILEIMAKPNPGSDRAKINEEDQAAFRKLIGLPIKEKYQGMKNAVGKYIVRPEANAFGIEGFWLILKLMEVKMRLDAAPPEKEEPKAPAPLDNPFKFN